MNDTVIAPKRDNLQIKLVCPSCGKAVRLPYSDGNTIAVPLICEHCNHGFRPRFYCPDHKSPRYHVFEAESLYLDNLHSLYTFCPEHTYTTYDLAQPTPSNSPITTRVRMWFVESLKIFLFRSALTLESARQRLFARHRL